MRLEHLLHSQGFGSRKACRSLILQGRVKVAGAPCIIPDAEFAAEGLEFHIDASPWRYRRHVYVMLNKPAGHECSRSPTHHPSVLALLPEALQNRAVQPVGRLDEDTTGLLLLSDDGQFIHRLISPRHEVTKVYEVTAKHPVDDNQIGHLLAGVQLHDEPAPIAAVGCERVAERVIRLRLAEGKYHQVKRMLAAAGNRVERLKRIAVGGLELPDDLPEGGWRWLETADLERIDAQP